MPKPRRSPCPIACTLDLIGDRWTLLVVRDCLFGKSQFKEFRASPEGIATNILTDRLARLVDHGVLARDEAGYHLTPKGKSLLPILEFIKDWGLANIQGTAARMKPKVK
jgi:DNA-binding HxlR family transcriptional regulator